jgi:hypothetical protein
MIRTESANMRSSSRPEFILGLIFAVIAGLGAVFLGWDFSGTNQAIPTVLGIVAAVVAITLVFRNR